MIRKLILSAVVAIGTIAGVIVTSTPADAAAPIGHDRDWDRDHRGVRFEVQVRHHGCWEIYSVYRDREDAQRAVRMLERRGQDARIEIERR